MNIKMLRSLKGRQLANMKNKTKGEPETHTNGEQRNLTNIVRFRYDLQIKFT